ncbi:transposase [Burkholderia ambifaria]|nr:transposase [Burkholderia ambifaria]
MDEFEWRKGHRQATVVVELVGRQVLRVSSGRSRKMARAFLEQLPENVTKHCNRHLHADTREKADQHRAQQDIGKKAELDHRRITEHLWDIHRRERDARAHVADGRRAANLQKALQQPPA